MNRLVFILSLCFFHFPSFSQTVFWTENFEGNPCNSGCDPSLISWTTTNTGANAASANKWYVSCADNGQAAGVCGAGCGNDESLHVGSTTLGDIGAAYDATRTTNKRVESPTINCTGYSGITINFNYITYGEPGFDFGSFLYFDGTSWINIANPIAVTTCCAAGSGGAACNGFRQGYWTAYTTSLPVSANNNANVKIGFNWTNDASSGSDPSFAIDDITLSYTSSLPIELLYFDAKISNGKTKLEWVTETEVNNDYFTIERSIDGELFEPIIFTSGAGNSTTSNFYSTIDESPPTNRHIYYRLKQTDFDGNYTYSEIIAVKITDDDYNINQRNDQIYISSTTGLNLLEIFDISGRLIYSSNFSEHKSINTSTLKSGIYILKITGKNKSLIKKMKF